MEVDVYTLGVLGMLLPTCNYPFRYPQRTILVVSPVGLFQTSTHYLGTLVAASSQYRYSNVVPIPPPPPTYSTPLYPTNQLPVGIQYTSSSQTPPHPPLPSPLLYPIHKPSPIYKQAKLPTYHPTPYHTTSPVCPYNYITT